MRINLNNKKFKSLSNSVGGEVSGHTVFIYFQEDKMVWAEYSGGRIMKGFLIGIIVNDLLEFTYQHLNKDLELMTGKGKSIPQLNTKGKIILKEHWEWTCKDFGKGDSTLIEI